MKKARAKRIWTGNNDPVAKPKKTKPGKPGLSCPEAGIPGNLSFEEVDALRPDCISKKDWDRIPYDRKPIYGLNEIGEVVWLFGKVDKGSLCKRILEEELWRQESV